MNGQLPLPGLEPPAATEGALSAAVRRTIAAHQAEERLSELDAGACAIALELCAIVEAKRRQGRMSTVSNDLRLLTELLDAMKPDDGEGSGELRAVMEEWERQIRDQEQAQP